VGEAGLPEAQVEGDLLPGQYAFIQVKDSGCGMDEATRR